MIIRAANRMITIIFLAGALLGAQSVTAQTAEGNSDHQQMLAKLKITSPLRFGPAGLLNDDGTVPPNCANHD